MSLTPREIRHKRIRKKIIGTGEKPRLCVFRSLKNMSAQLIDDMSNKTIIALSTNGPVFKGKIKNGGNVKAAVMLGEEFAKLAKEKGVTQVVFDRAGLQYHGRVKALAETCRKSGLKF